MIRIIKKKACDILKVRRIILGFFIIAMMIMIFIFSSQQGTASGGLSESIALRVITFFNHEFDSYPKLEQKEILDSFEFLIRKGAHMTEYAILAGLIFLFFAGLRLYLRVSFSFIITLLYSISDEVHQYFVPGRSGVYTDVIIDMIGAMFALICLSFITHIYHKHKIQKLSQKVIKTENKA